MWAHLLPLGEEVGHHRSWCDCDQEWKDDPGMTVGWLSSYFPTCAFNKDVEKTERPTATEGAER